MSRIKIFLIRHASPDLSHKNIIYSVLPGPPLSSQGEIEAGQLAIFLKKSKIVRIYCSPFLRTLRTAQILSDVIQIPAIEEVRLMEWQDDETEEDVKKRMKLVFDNVAKEAFENKTIGLVTHGGPIRALLQELGLSSDRLALSRSSFDNANPLPPAGTWGAEWNKKAGLWRLKLEFVPTIF
jgi:broad specificity phosphatase PhoE